jgi:hypothetical protein
MSEKSQTKKQQEKMPDEFKSFELLTKNLLAVSNIEVRERMKEEKRAKKTIKRKAR